MYIANPSLHLREIWNELTATYADDQELIAELWTEIAQNYSSPKRHYHNLDHLAFMLDLALVYQDKLEDSDTLLFSIFYHDIIYHIKRKDNELKSAEVAKDRLIKLGLAAGKISKCYQQIIATKAHQENSDSDSCYLLDMDLAILGVNSEAYQLYAKKVRKEYSVYPDFFYNRGRKKVLRHFIGKERIFKTKAFYDKYERQAKVNLGEELLML